MLRRLIREPLVHFLLLGGLLFAVSGRAREAAPGSSGKILVSASQIESLTTGFSRTWMRPPTDQELKGLVEEYIREEVLYREAMAMGLDRDDTIVRRRMRQKLEFLTEDLASQSAPPSDQELQAYLEVHADKFREELRFAFEHVYFSREKRGASAEAQAKAMLARLNSEAAASVDMNSVGDAFLLPFEFAPSSEGEIARLFGERFSQHVAETETGRWAGPYDSSYGLHLVRVRERVPGRVAELARVRDAVLREVLNERRRQALEAAYAKLRQRYTIEVEQPKPHVAEVR